LSRGHLKPEDVIVSAFKEGKDLGDAGTGGLEFGRLSSSTKRMTESLAFTRLTVSARLSW